MVEVTDRYCTSGLCSTVINIYLYGKLSIEYYIMILDRQYTIQNQCGLLIGDHCLLKKIKYTEIYNHLSYSELVIILNILPIIILTRLKKQRFLYWQQK